MRDVVKTAPQGNGRKRRRRKRNLSLYYLMIFVILVVILYILSRTVLFRVEQYDIVGNERYTDYQILSAAGLSDSENLYNIDLSVTASKIKKQLIYIDDVTVTRRLPSTLVIEITEAQEFACCLYEGNRYAVISRNGRYLSTEQASPDETLLQIYGLDLVDVSLGDEFKSSDSNKKSIIMNLLSAIEELCEGKIDYIDITDRTDIVMSYDGRIEVEFGSSLDYEYKLRYIVEIIETKLDSDTTGKLIYISASEGVAFIPEEGLEELEQNRNKVSSEISSDEEGGSS